MGPARGKVVTTALGAGPRPLRAALSLREMVLLVLGEDEVLHDGLPLPGRTQEEAREWLEATVARLGGGEAPLEAPSHPAPSHPLLDEEARYAEQGEEARIELGRLFAAGQDALGAVQRGRPDWGPLRLWPHHFDLATLRPLDPDGGQEARSIGAGLAPGGPGEEPYLYVLPWPPPADDAALRAGRWTREGFVGARLDLGQVLEAHPLERGEQVEEFLEGAIAACEELLGA